MSNLKNDKKTGLLILFIIYVLASAIGIGVFNLLLPIISSIYLNIFICDVIATMIVFIFGMILKTASVYDPYWSVQTVVIYIGLMIHVSNINLGNVILLLAILFWAIRLTNNFIKGFNNLTYVDWRYKKIQDKCGAWYPLVCFLGICLVPTIVVYLASLPAFVYVLELQDFSIIQLIGLSIMIIATIIELVSDRQMKKFISIRKDKSEIINFGLWKYVRHPNYLGEILFWYGLALVAILTNTTYLIYGIGAIANTLLFIFISIPLEENHFKSYKPNYTEYRKNTSCLLPIKCLFKKKDKWFK